jgi:hypothetical protein
MTTFNRRIALAAGGMALAHGAVSAARAARPDGQAAGVPAAPNDNQSAAAAGSPPARYAPPSFPSTDPELVGDVVGAAHTDLERVTELVTARPHLARASVDWGFGDWESALGAASHMGRRDIADLLLAHGARPSIFSAAMLGQLAAVRGLIEASPGVQRIPGPHGLTLLHHARVGGERAASVREYLEGLGDADITPDDYELTDEQKQAFVGSYGFEAESRASLEITDVRGTLSLQRQGAPFGRRIFPVSETEFYPSGSPTVRITFDVRDGNVTGLRVVDSEVILTATRLAG